MRIVFAGTPSFAVPSLARLVASSHEVVAVVTQPDRPAGRGLAVRPSAVKRWGQEHGLTVFEPEKFNSRSLLDKLADMRPDLISVVAYGKIFRRRALSLPRWGCVNVHASLLPKYRGVAPINWAIINGESETGVTTFFMEEGVDTGKIILSRSSPIGEDETAGDLYDRLAELGADVLVESCDLIESGSSTPIEQDHSLASYAPKLTKQDGWIRWNRPARAVHDHIRGVTPWPGAFTEFGELRIKILNSACCESRHGSAGEVVGVDSGGGILVSCSVGSIWLSLLQAPGKKPVTGADFVRGYRVGIGDRFGHDEMENTEG